MSELMRTDNRSQQAGTETTEASKLAKLDRSEGGEGVGRFEARGIWRG